jgi:selenide,water dikinase
MSAESLAQVLQPLQDLYPPSEYPDLLLGIGDPDDAAIWKLDDEKALAITIDFFTPIVDDPHPYGSIAAANALSDLYAMGAVPIFALNVAAMPANLDSSIVREILRGGAEKVREAKAVIAGGHTILDEEPKYGLVAIGIVKQSELMLKSNARPGDKLVLTKPIGTGVTTTALKQGKADPLDVLDAICWMEKLNADASELAKAHGIRAATDITGFSLLGHAIELAEASRVGMKIHHSAVPFLDYARKYAELGTFPGGSADNKTYFGERVEFSESIDEYDQLLMFDAQTSGGLLLSVPAGHLSAFIRQANHQGVSFWVIGEVEQSPGIRVLD